MSIWKNRDFVWLVSGQSISQLGSAISIFAIPWLLLQLTGSALQMGLVFALGFLPYLLLSLPAGVWADRFDRKRLMILADVGRAVLLLSIPIAAFFDLLSVWQLYVVEAGMSAFTVLFDASYVACLPNIVNREQLQEANAALQTGSSVSQIAGPAVAGALVALIGSANTIVLDVASFLISIFSLFMIHRSFSVAGGSTLSKGKMFSQIQEGMQFVWGHDLIRTISLFTMIGNLGFSATGAVLLYRISHELNVTAGWAGVIMSGTAIGFLIGSLFAGPICKRYPMGPTMGATLAIQVFPPFVIAFTSQPIWIVVSNLIMAISFSIWNVQSVSLRQSVIPDHLLGRASSSIRMVVWGSIPVGSAGGGAMGQAFGAPAVFFASGILNIGIWVWGQMTPLFRMTRVESAESDLRSEA